MKKILTMISCLFLFTPVAFAEEIIIELPEGVEVSNEKITYQCGDEEVTATYINAGAISLAQLHIKGDTFIAANVLAASGAKYAGGEYIWWTAKGEASLYNLLQDPEQEKPITCTPITKKQD